MSEFQLIQSTLERAASRRRIARALTGLWWGLLVGTIIALVIVGTYHLIPIPFWTLLAAAFVPLPCMLVGLVIGGWRKPALNEVARWVDGRQHLQERLSTALEVSAVPEPTAWSQLVVTDAAVHARDIDPRRLMPFTLPRASRWALLVLALTAGLGFVPAYRSKAFLQKQAEQANIKEVGRQLAELTRHNLEKRTPALEPTQKALDAAGELANQLAKQDLGRSEALKSLANVAEKLKDELRELGKDPALKKLEQAARASSGSDSQTAAGIQKQMDALQKQLGAPVGNPDALEKLQRELEKLKDAAKGLADKNSPASDAERQKLSDSLSALSRQMQEMGLQLPQLDEAIQALAANQTDMVLRDIQASLNDLEKMRDMAKSLQQLQQQAEKLGKDLAEQLKNGQPEAAQMTLQKMVNQLNSANLSSEQMQKMMEEVSKAINPAGNYGQVADHLKKAAKEMQASNKAAAGESLASAAKELDKLMQQMGDAQSLSSELSALDQAAMAIGNGQGWRAAGKRPGTGQSDSFGSGVGTWAENEAGAWTGEFTDRWDNSGVVRPDEDPRGHTDRGDGQLNDALSPTKVKGHFSPGGQMPSITLKGVSIKGQSKIDYEPAATAAAQSDAQSALSQDKVPRAYQGAVRDYFDDIKK